jgi:hypothetical protein
LSGYQITMAELGSCAPSWSRWAEGWSAVFLLGGLWTLFTLPRSGIVAALLFFGLCALVSVGVARDGGATTPWSMVPLAAVGVTSMLGPLVDQPFLTLLLAAPMAATTPPARARISARRARLAVGLLSDWGLAARWDDSEVELRDSRRPDQAHAVVLRREEILDELVRRGRVPYE